MDFDHNIDSNDNGGNDSGIGDENEGVFLKRFLQTWKIIRG